MLITILITATSVGCELGSAPPPDEAPVYLTVLRHLDGESLAAPGFAVVHPGTIRTDVSTGIQAPWDQGEYYSVHPSDVIREAAEAVPDISVCTLDPEGACELAGGRTNIVAFSAIDWVDQHEARLWVTVASVIPTEFFSRTWFFQLHRVDRKWGVTSATVTSTEN